MQEASRYLEKARQSFSNARAGRAYLAAVDASQAFIFDCTGRIAKTHHGVQSEFHRLTRDELRIDKVLPISLAQAYNLKAAADYETGHIPLECSAAARFVDRIAAFRQ